MNVEVSEYISVSSQLALLGGASPKKFAILPRNIPTATSFNELRQVAESDTIRTILKTNKIVYEEVFDKNNQPPYIQQYSSEWFGPTLFISASALVQNPELISIVMGLITNYLYDLFKGSESGEATLDVVYESENGTCKRIHYKGPYDGLGEIAGIISKLEKNGHVDLKTE